MLSKSHVLLEYFIGLHVEYIACGVVVYICRLSDLNNIYFTISKLSWLKERVYSK